MRRLGYAVVLLAVAVIGLSFAVRNPQTVELAFYFGISWQAPLAVVLALALLAGFLLGWLLATLRGLRWRRELARLRRSARDAAGGGRAGAGQGRDMAVSG